MRAQTSGFTLVELMVTLAVLVILATVAVPSMKSLYEANRANSGISLVQDALVFARSHAISYGADVKVAPASGTNWSNGIKIYMVKGGSNQTLKLVEGINSSDKIKSTVSELTFKSDGVAAAGATFIYCPAGSSTESRSLVLSASGIVKSGAKNQSCN